VVFIRDTSDAVSSTYAGKDLQEVEELLDSHAQRETDITAYLRTTHDSLNQAVQSFER
jgi:hypothetical protein